MDGRGRKITSFPDIVNKILAIDGAMRHVGIIDNKGKIILSKMKENKIALHDTEQKARISYDLFLLKQMFDVFDGTLGKTSMIHLVREKIHLLIFYISYGLIYVTCEPNMEPYKVTEISIKIQEIISKDIY
ncbi:MAG: hypothetical protein WCC52_05755 [Nitrosotalea sp.]